MPSFRAPGAAETTALEQSAEIAQAYDAYLADFTLSDYGLAELGAGERRSTVRRMLQAAAHRRGFRLRFRPGRAAALVFQVEEAPPAPTLAPPPELALPEVASPAQAAHPARQRDRTPPRPSHREESAVERYRTVLPRWMRDGKPAGQRGERKRRTRS